MMGSFGLMAWNKHVSVKVPPYPATRALKMIHQTEHSRGSAKQSIQDDPVEQLNQVTTKTKSPPPKKSRIRNDNEN